jgi:hypothetical protein
VRKALQNNWWVAHILPLQTVQELHEYATLWEQVQETTLEENSEDTIRWRWTVEGNTQPKLQKSIHLI